MNTMQENTSRMQSEFMGCDHDIDEELGNDDEDLAQRAPHKLAEMTLDAATNLLRRDDEVAAAKKKGRHREAHMHMKAFADKFGSTLTATLPPLSHQHSEMPPRLLGPNASEALAHQRTVRNAMRKDQTDLRSSVGTNAKQDDLQAMLAALENLQEQEAEATCVTIPLPELLRGPKHVAELIMEAQREEGRILNDEQQLLFALWVDKLQEAFTRRPNPEEPYLVVLGPTWCD